MTPAIATDSRSKAAKVLAASVAMMLAAIAFSACRNDEAAPEPAARLAPRVASAGASASASAPAPSRAPGSTPATVAYPNTDADHERKYRELLGRARRLQKAGDLAGAEQAFIAATGSGQDVYHRAVAELSFLDLDLGKRPRAEIEAQFLVASASPESDVRGQAWFNLARLYREAGEPEAERAALARSLAESPTAAAKSRLGQRSTCVAEVGPRTPRAKPVIVTGWVGVCRELQLCNDAPVSEEEARKLACLECSGSAAEPDESHGCSDSPPWRSSFRYQHYGMDLAFIAPTTRGQFFVIASRVGGWPAICGSLFDYSADLAGDTMHIREQLTASDVARGRDAPQADAVNGLCWDAPETRSHTFYDTKTAKLLATLQLVEGLPVEVTLDAAARRVRLAGGGCDGSLPLDGSNRWLSAPQ